MTRSGFSARSNTTWDIWRRRLATLNLLLGVLFVAIFGYYAVRGRFLVPYVDDWAMLGLLEPTHLLSLGLLQPHSEHIIVIPRLLLWTDFQIWGWPGYAAWIAALACYVAVGLVLVLACRGRDRDEARFLMGSVLVLNFLTYALQGAVFPSAIVFPLIAASSTLAMASLAQCVGNTNARSVIRWAALSAAMSVLAILSLTNGLVLPFILTALALLIRLPVRIALAFLALGLAGAYARYALAAVPASAFIASPSAIGRFALAMFAGPVGSISPSLAIWVGGGFCIMTAAVLWRFVRARVHRGVDVLIAGTLGFIVASMAMAAVGRAQFDLSVAAESRYAELAALGWTCLLLAVMPPGASNRRLGKFAMVVLPIVAIVALPFQILVGRVWAAKADHLETASLALAVGVRDDDWTWRMHPMGASYVEPVLPMLRARGVKFVTFPALGEPVTGPASPAACNGSVNGITSGEASAGLRVYGHILEPGTTLRIIDSKSRVRGLAKPAPTVTHARATPNDFVWAEIEALTGRPTNDGMWLGFTAWGSGPPFRAELLDASGQLVCHVPMTCCSAPREEPARQELIVRGGLLEGWLEVADCTMVTGWAWDSGRPHQPINVRVSISNGEDVVIAASTFRQHLVDHGKGNGRHAFAVAAQDLELGSGTWTIGASIAENGVPLNGSPRTVVCQ